LHLHTRELERERALKLVTEARLSSLESPIHPHFLFNALDSISELIPEDPERAERLIERMAALLPCSLDSDRNGLVLHALDDLLRQPEIVFLDSRCPA
jgi:two-component system, LytTR family, sensor histidine kinase AlgZ